MYSTPEGYGRDPHAPAVDPSPPTHQPRPKTQGQTRTDQMALECAVRGADRRSQRDVRIRAPDTRHFTCVECILNVPDGRAHAPFADCVRYHVSENARRVTDRCVREVPYGRASDIRAAVRYRASSNVSAAPDRTVTEAPLVRGRGHLRKRSVPDRLAASGQSRNGHRRADPAGRQHRRK
jgi:hypothetical protein